MAQSSLRVASDYEGIIPLFVLSFPISEAVSPLENSGILETFLILKNSQNSGSTGEPPQTFILWGSFYQTVQE